MAEEKKEKKGGGGGSALPIIILLAILILGALSRGGGGGGSFMKSPSGSPGSGTQPLSGSIALDDIPSDPSLVSPTPSQSQGQNDAPAYSQEQSQNPAPYVPPTTSNPAPVTAPPVIIPTGQTSRATNDKIERNVSTLYNKLDGLDAKVRDLTLRSPISPYADVVNLSAGAARSEVPDDEFVLITASSKNLGGTNISNWYLQSIVTDETVALPRGDRVMEKWRSPVLEDILLDPGEQARIFSASSPIDVSFRENLCTGYLAEEKTFKPSLSRSCPRPLDDMLKFGDIKLDDDSCYDFVERLQRCVPLDEDAMDAADLSRACTRFLESSIGYNECVSLHRTDPFFDNPGTWRVYLDRDENLWRKEREIIRLMDENDLVIDYIEY